MNKKRYETNKKEILKQGYKLNKGKTDWIKYPYRILDETLYDFSLWSFKQLFKI